MNEQLVARGRKLWAKSSEDGVGQSLLAHLLDVGLVADALLDLRLGIEARNLATELDITLKEAKTVLVTFAALHDIGKAIPVFQAKWPHGAPEEALGVKSDDVPHGRASGIILRSWLIETGIPKRLATSFANAAAIHHGNRLPGTFATPGTYDPRSVGEGSPLWERWQRALIQDVLEALGPLPIFTTRRALRARSWALLSGLTSVADWIGSSLPHAGYVLDPAEYVETRRATIQTRLQDLGWHPQAKWWHQPERPEEFSSWFGSGASTFEARPLQRATAKLTAARSEPFLLVVEAPMGEGKTEAAFFAMVQPLGEAGAYLALPTQATSDAMHARVRAFVERHASRRVEIALAHGGARIATKMMRANLESDYESLESQAVAESWFSTGRRELLAEIGVGTVDQALLGVIPTRHFFVRLWGLTGKVVVLDEVHAYDAYTGGLVSELVKWLAAVGASVVLMSATLPTDVRTDLIRSFEAGQGLDQQPIPQLPYPRVTRVSKDGVSGLNFLATKQSTVRVTEAPFELELLAQDILRASEGGAAVLAVLNDVGRAQGLYKLCVSHQHDVSLLHARMPLIERKQREADLVSRYGPSSDTEDRTGVVIATQVVEQSLDLDFDVLYSDLAPIDLLFQRAGRIHRHARPSRPITFQEPQLFIAGLTSTTSTGPNLEALDTVYSPLLMWRTWGVLSESKLLNFPDDIDKLVQRVYSSEAIPELTYFEDQLRAAALESETADQAKKLAAQAWSLGAPLESAVESWGEAGRDDDDAKAYHLRVPTRLGDDTVTVVPIRTFGGSWLVYGHDGSAVTGGPRTASDAFVSIALSNQIRVSRKSLISRLRNQPVPSWWSGSGVLRRFYPLLLDETGTAKIDGNVRLDQDLGLVYPERSRSA